jgi:predicted nicotinamide N-methyase
VLENLRHNLTVNISELKTARVKNLDWDEEEWDHELQLPDIVLGADIVYDPRVIPSLVATLTKLLAPGAVAYIVSTLRNCCCNDVIGKDTCNNVSRFQPAKIISQIQRTKLWLLTILKGFILLI